MPPDLPPRKLPSLFEHESRLETLEKCEREWQFINKPRLMRELGSLQRRMGDLERKKTSYRPEMDSQTDLSIRPGGLRLSLRNVPAWAVVVVVLALSVSVTLWLLGR